MEFVNLDPSIRDLMRTEIERDVTAGSLYLSPRLSHLGRQNYEAALRQAAASGTEANLGAAIGQAGWLVSHETRQTKHGPVSAAVPVSAPSTLAEGEFNRFYIRAVCLRALELGHRSVLVYRAKEVADPRPESMALVGSEVDPAAVLDDLRTHQGVDTALGLPPGPNSGLSLRLA